MIRGQGQGRANQRGVIAASCGAITCLTFFFLIGVPMLIASAVLFAIANGNFDYIKKSRYNHCSWFEKDDFDFIWNSWSSWSSWSAFDECNDLEQEWDDWTQAKENMRIAAIILIVISMLSLIGGAVMLILMCTTMFKSSGGAMHGPQPQAVSMTTATVAYPQQQGYQAVVSGYNPIGQHPPPPQAQPPAHPMQSNLTSQYPVQPTQQPYPPQPTQQSYPPQPMQQQYQAQPQPQYPQHTSDTSYQKGQECEPLQQAMNAPPAYNPDYK